MSEISAAGGTVPDIPAAGRLALVACEGCIDLLAARVVPQEGCKCVCRVSCRGIPQLALLATYSLAATHSSTPRNNRSTKGYSPDA